MYNFWFCFRRHQIFSTQKIEIENTHSQKRVNADSCTVLLGEVYMEIPRMSIEQLEEVA